MVDSDPRLQPKVFSHNRFRKIESRILHPVLHLFDRSRRKLSLRRYQSHIARSHESAAAKHTQDVSDAKIKYSVGATVREVPTT
jgi:hypothetical protein